MRWEGRRESGNIEDRRGMSGMGVGLPLGGGVGGLIVLLLISWLTGTNPLDLISSSSVPQDQTVGTTGVCQVFPGAINSIPSEVRLEIDRPRAADLGVSVMDIEQALNTLVAGQTASTYNAGEDQYDVVVRAQEKFRGGVEGLAKMTVPSKKVGSVGLDEVVRIHPGTGPSSINRIARQRQVTLTGNTLPGGSQAAIIQALNEATKTLNMDPGYRAGLTGGSKELGRTGYYFMLAFALTFISRAIGIGKSQEIHSRRSSRARGAPGLNGTSTQAGFWTIKTVVAAQEIDSARRSWTSTSSRGAPTPCGWHTGGRLILQTRNPVISGAIT